MAGGGERPCFALPQPRPFGKAGFQRQRMMHQRHDPQPHRLALRPRIEHAEGETVDQQQAILRQSRKARFRASQSLGIR